MYTISLFHHKMVFLKKHYRAFVITSLSLAILAMIWYLRAPLYNKYLVVDAKNFPLILMSDKFRYLVSEGDFLSGKAIPNSKIKVLLNPGRIKKTITVDSDGLWFYQIPSDVEKKRYRLTVADFDKDKKLAFVKDYRVRIQSNNILQQNPLKKIFSLSSVNAQTTKATSPSASLQPQADDIILLNFTGDVKGEGEINVETIASSNGSVADSFQAIVALEQTSLEEGIFLGKNLGDPATSIIPLKGGENCTKSCQVKLPEKIDKNSYLTVYLISSGSIVDLDYFPLIFDQSDFSYPLAEETVSQQVISEEGTVTEEEIQILQEEEFNT